MVDTTPIRFSQFNASLNRNANGKLGEDLSVLDNAQARSVAEIIQRVQPDILLINEFDYFTENPTQPVELFLQNYLLVGQNGAQPVDYPYYFIAPSNTGIPSGFDLNNNGVVATIPGTPGYGDDAFGFGSYPGQFGMLLLSKYPIDLSNVRTFLNFLWQDMPDSLLPTIALPGSDSPWYSQEEQAVLRLSSKSHWDVPIQIDGKTIHVLASHPTPPVFDGLEDRNGKRNYDEIRFWADYVTPGKGDYIYDDQGRVGGLTPGSSFVIMGDQNADPFDGDSFDRAILQLLQNPSINTNFIPSSVGAVQQSELQGRANANHQGNPAFDTADFADNNPGNLRADYVLPSSDLQIINSAVFWPVNTDPNFSPVGTFPFPSSDHRLVWVDIQQQPVVSGNILRGVEFLEQTTFATGFIPPGTAGTINDVNVPMGGLSGVAYDAGNNLYYGISDDRSQFGPARFYTFTLDLDTLNINFVNVTPIQNADGSLFGALTVDPEGIALTNQGTIFVSSEGEVNINAARITDPFVKEYSLLGEEIRSLPVPNKFLPVIEDTNGSGVVDAGDRQISGVRNNLAFESLTITPDQRTLYTATENALIQDGERSSLVNGSPSRIIQYNLLSGQPEKEYLYITDAVAVPPVPVTAFSDNGLVDLLAIDNRGTLLAVERSFSLGVPGTGFTIKIYEVSLQGATDISFYESLSDLNSEQLAGIVPAHKRLLLNLNDLNLDTGLDNIEGLAFGPRLSDGRQSIVLVSDNNFNQNQFTQILTLSADLIPTVIPRVETRPDLFDDEDPAQGLLDQNADADDPAIYVNAINPAESLVLTAVKNAGIRVYDLSGNLLQTVNPGNVRYNNIDLQYGFQLGGESVDIAVASDRGNDTLVFFKINPSPTEPGKYLDDISDRSIGNLFQTAPFNPPYSTSSRSAYGLAMYRSPFTNDYYVFVNRRETGDVAQFQVIDRGNGKIGVERVREFTISTPPGVNPQTEGMVVDQETGFLYVGQENVGIWKFLAEPTAHTNGILIDQVKALGGQYLTDDVEGLTIYYGVNGAGYLLVSSQGDDTFAVYNRQGNNEYLGRFSVGSNGAIDSVQESDGADVINVPLGPNFPYGLFVTQDGNNQPEKLVEDDGELENVNSNFKFIPWENIAGAFPIPLIIDTTSYNPRSPISQPKVTLLGFASLPADTFAIGPSSGSAITGNTNGRQVPFDSQPIQGFSAIQIADPNSFWLMSDNGFGSKANSPDYLLRIYRATPNFRTTAGGNATVNVLDFVQLSDPDNKIPFRIVNENTRERLLTGADFDPESLVVGADGTFWIGEEFGPYILHFDSTGRLLEEPIPTPNYSIANTINPEAPLVLSPDSPDLIGSSTSNLARSRGFEGMAISPNKTRIYPLLEGTVLGDPPNSLRIYQLDPQSKEFQGLLGYYRMEQPNHAIGALTVVNENEFLVIERDNGQGPTAGFKKIFKVDFSNIDPNGFVAKEELVDLLNISDPNDLNGDGSTKFTFPFVTIEAVVVIDENTIVVTNDNNYPFSLGRPPAIDNNEIILLRLEQPLNLPKSAIIQGTAGSDDLTISQSGSMVFTGNGDDMLEASLTSNVNIDAGRGNDIVSLGSGSFASGGDGDDTLYLGGQGAVAGTVVDGGRGNDTLMVIEANDSNILLGAADHDHLQVAEGRGQILFGGSGRDILRSSPNGHNRLYGGSGDDQLFCTVGDRLFGGDGNDSLYAGQGGNNLLWGGEGADNFWLVVGGSLPDVPNVIKDFQVSVDRIGMSGITDNQVSLLSQNGNTLIRVAGTDVALIEGVNQTQLNVNDSSQFVFA